MACKQIHYLLFRALCYGMLAQYCAYEKISIYLKNTPIRVNLVSISLIDTTINFNEFWELA